MDTTQFETFREALINAPEGATTRVIFLAGSFALAAVILYLVRKRALREEYTSIWMAVAIGLVIVSVRMGGVLNVCFHFRVSVKLHASVGSDALRRSAHLSRNAR